MASKDEDVVEVTKINFLDPVAIAVGKNGTPFHVPKNLDCSRSEFFAAACSKEWNRTGESIRLLEDDPEIFSVYLQLLYTGNPVVAKEHVADTFPEYMEDLEEEWLKLVKTYVMADKFGDRKGANTVMNDIVKRCDSANTQLSNNPSAKAISYAYNHSLDNSPLRHIFVHYAAFKASQHQIDFYMDDTPRDFIRNVLQTLVAMRKCAVIRPSEWNIALPTTYHI